MSVKDLLQETLHFLPTLRKKRAYIPLLLLAGLFLNEKPKMIDRDRERVVAYMETIESRFAQLDSLHSPMRCFDEQFTLEIQAARGLYRAAYERARMAVTDTTITLFYPRSKKQADDVHLLMSLARKKVDIANRYVRDDSLLALMDSTVQAITVQDTTDKTFLSLHALIQACDIIDAKAPYRRFVAQNTFTTDSTPRF